TPVGFLPEDREHVDRTFRHALRTETEWHVECRLRRPDDGTTRWIEVRGRPHRDGGRPTYFLGIVGDITERKAAEGALRRSKELLEDRIAERTRKLTEANAKLRAEAAERERVEDALRQSHKMEAVGQLTGGIAHDFNNMLQAIGGSLELMSRRVEQGRLEEAGRLVATAQTTVERAAFLTHRLLAFARRQSLQPRPVEVDALVCGLIELIRRMAGPQIEIDLRPRDGIWTVMCDPNQLENVLLNLAINSRDAMPNGGTLTIATSDLSLSAPDVAGDEDAQPGDYVEITVSDTGIGMDEMTRRRAFEPFFTTKPLGQGTGLGLSQVYGFVRQSGGIVRLESTLGQGTTVRLYLPRHARVVEADAVPAAKTKPDAEAASAVVLLVEDEALVRSTVAATLRDLGYQVLEAGNGPMALQALEGGGRNPVDLLVTDVGLPGGLNGRQVADAARAIKPDLPVLFITGYAGAILEGQLAPGMVMIGKPFTLEAIAAKVKSMIEGSSDGFSC
ncbi:MAG TPA: ATP-binding protein, partial [Rhodopila sp.]